MNSQGKKIPLNFKTMAQADVPQGRKGKHSQIVRSILADLSQLPAGIAIKVPLAELEDSKANVRSALNRAVHKHKRRVTTASDANFLYVWNESESDQN